MDNLFSTHPDTGNRIAALQAMARDFKPAPPAGPASGPDAAIEPVRGAAPKRTSRSVPPTGWGRGGSRPPKGPWS